MSKMEEEKLTLEYLGKIDFGMGFEDVYRGSNNKFYYAFRELGDILLIEMKREEEINTVKRYLSYLDKYDK